MRSFKAAHTRIHDVEASTSRTRRVNPNIMPKIETDASVAHLQIDQSDEAYEYHQARNSAANIVSLNDNVVILENGNVLQLEGDSAIRLGMCTDVAMEEVVIGMDGTEGEVHNVPQGGYVTDRTLGTDAASNLSLFKAYQPISLGNGEMLCRICLQTGKSIRFQSNKQFMQHRYRNHGAFYCHMPCPVDSCTDSYASFVSLKKHLYNRHKLPVETLCKRFANFHDFKQWQSLIESVSGERYLHVSHRYRTKNRQVLYCRKSEHRAELNLRSVAEAGQRKMKKEGACCPAHISYFLRKDGSVEVVFQPFHYGHNDAEEPAGAAKQMLNGNINVHQELVERPLTMGGKPMQYIQIDIVEMSLALYGMNRYTHMLIMTDLRTQFIWARPLQDSFDRTHIVRILTDIFTQFGVPEGYSASMSYELIREAMDTIGYIFKTPIYEIGNQTPDYMRLRNMFYDTACLELNNKDRWAEIVHFVTLRKNAVEIPKDFKKTPFELMFGREAFCDRETKDNDLPPWIDEPNAPKMHIKFRKGDMVLMRHFDAAVSSRQHKNEQRQIPTLNGLIGEVDWHRTHFPYKVHYSTEASSWPPTDINAPYLWVSPFDLTSTSTKMLYERDGVGRQILDTTFCACGTAGQCPLFRAEFCANKMSLSCCKELGTKECSFHADYDSHSESYVKLSELYERYRKSYEMGRRDDDYQEEENDVTELSVGEGRSDPTGDEAAGEEGDPSHTQLEQTETIQTEQQNGYQESAHPQQSNQGDDSCYREVATDQPETSTATAPYENDADIHDAAGPAQQKSCEQRVRGDVSAEIHCNDSRSRVQSMNECIDDEEEQWIMEEDPGEVPINQWGPSSYQPQNERKHGDVMESDPSTSQSSEYVVTTEGNGRKADPPPSSSRKRKQNLKEVVERESESYQNVVDEIKIKDPEPKTKLPKRVVNNSAIPPPQSVRRSTRCTRKSNRLSPS